MFSVQARTVASITLRATMGRRRALVFAIPAVILVLVSVLLKAANPSMPTGRASSWAASGWPWCCR